MTLPSTGRLSKEANWPFSTQRCRLATSLMPPARSCWVSGRIPNFQTDLSIQYEQGSPRHPQSRQREQRRQLRGVLREPAVAVGSRMIPNLFLRTDEA